MFVDEEAAQHLRRHPLQQLHIALHLVAIQAIEHATSKLGAQRHIQGALQVRARGAADPALLFVLAEELLQDPLCLYGRDIVQLGDGTTQALHLFATQPLEDLGS